MNTKPRILLLNEPHPKARAIMEEVAGTSNKHKWIDYDGIFTTLEPIDKKVLSLAQNIKFIATPCTGTDHIVVPDGVKLIHLDDAWKANEGREVTSTAEHTWSLILQLAKMKRMQLNKKHIGIIGFGRVGRMVFEYAKAFSMKISVIDKENYVNENLYGLEYVLQSADIITLHIPLQNNEGFFGEREFAMMKDGALLINTSRFRIIDAKALFKAIDNKLGGYADDFKDEYGNMHDTNHPEYFTGYFDMTLHPCYDFSRKSNIIRTPHIAGNSLEARELTDCFIARKIKEFIEGGH